MSTLKKYNSSTGQWEYVIGTLEAPATQYLALSSPLDMPKSSADTIDDDFNSTTLNGKWTVVSGTSGTVDLLQDYATQMKKYDLTSMPGYLALQANYTNTRQDVSLRQDYTLGVGESVVMKCFPSAQISSNSDGEAQLMLVVNDTDSAPTGSGVGSVSIRFSVNLDGWELLTQYVAAAGGSTDSTFFDVGNEPAFNGLPVYFRINRDSTNVFSTFCSFNGISWTPMRKFTTVETFSNVWIVLRSDAQVWNYAQVPVQLVDYIRLGGIGMKPWSW